MRSRKAPPPAVPEPAGVQARSARPQRLRAGRQPLYVSLARTLARDIAQQRHPVGSLLPAEDVIATRHGVSRHTVRQALRELKDEGVISSHPGIGTRVLAPAETPRVFGGVNTISELLQFVEATQMRVLERKEIVADAAFAARFDCKPGQPWLSLVLLRAMPDQKRPLGHVQAYVRPEYGDVIGRQKLYTRPIYSHIEERLGVRIAEVLQEITAVNLDADTARPLKVAEGRAAMRITRYFLDRSGAVVEISVGHYPSGLYTQRSRFRTQRVEHDEQVHERIHTPQKRQTRTRKKTPAA
jgi:DNA-binding GntR family transcriptional regulator